MKQFFAVAFLSAFLFFACNKPAEETTETAPAEATPPPAEFADAKYTEIGKKGLAALTSGDVDGWMSHFADNAVYYWNNGDSLAGKPAITEYWKKRRTEVIDSLSYTDNIWLPVKINQPQANEKPGVWLLGWYLTTAKYKTGKSMTQWIHTLYHFDANDKIDQTIQFVDRVPINAAAMK